MLDTPRSSFNPHDTLPFESRLNRLEPAAGLPDWHRLFSLQAAAKADARILKQRSTGSYRA